MELSLIDPELTEATFIVNLLSDREPAPDPSPSPEPDPVVPTPTPSPEKSTPPPVTGLPETGAGEGSANLISVLVLAGSLSIIATAFVLRVRHRATR